jgi:hypothetical protein
VGHFSILIYKKNYIGKENIVKGLDIRIIGIILWHMNTEELEAPAWKCRLQRFLKAPKYGHDIFKLYYDEDKEYYK